MSRIEDALEKASQLQGRLQGDPREKAPKERTGSEKRLLVPKNSSIVTITEPDSPAAEEYRKLKTTILRIALQNVRQHALMVSSCVSGEGKSLTAINLAVSMAQEVGLSVLLIDADLRRPSLSDYLGITAASGLSECLLDGAPVSSAIIRTDIPGLDLLLAGKAVRNPVEILSSPTMRTLFNELKRSAPDRSIIIDTPPILPFAETQVISSMVDGILLVVKEGAITVQELEEALEIIDRAKILGVAYNDVTDKGMSNRYLHYYRYYAEKRHLQV